MARRKINFLKAKAVQQSFHIHRRPSCLTSMLDTMKLEHHSFQLQEDKSLKAVLRGLPTGILDAKVEADLRSKYLPIISDRSMTGNGQPKPLVFVNLQKWRIPGPYSRFLVVATWPSRFGETFLSRRKLLLVDVYLYVLVYLYLYRTTIPVQTRLWRFW